MIQLSNRLARLSAAKRRVLEKRLRTKPNKAEPIAIVSMACRFPGAKNLDQFWRVIDQGVDTGGEIPPSRWDVEKFYDPSGEISGKMSTRTGCFLEDVDQFDPLFFGITPREAAKMDPQQRLLLEVTWEALELGGLIPQQLSRSPTGVFVGIGSSDYAKVPCQFEDYYEHINAHSGTGNALSIAANRLSYILDLRGPSLAIDTACSSSLVAVHLAIQSLRNRECDMAIAGGVSLILTPETTIAFSKSQMLSTDGCCRPFSADANGYVRGEGCGVLVLKRLLDAVESGDSICAVLRASAVNQDGRTSGITAPNAESQQAVIRSALRQAGLGADSISYIEAHGTGTPLGDPIEIQALADVFRRGSQQESPCYVSSIKANIGHLETAAGIAGIIKVALLMQRGKIPPQLHFKQLNPNISLEGTRLAIPQAPVDWPSGQASRLAGVSSFGFGGTNAHVILEQAPTQPLRDEATRPLHLLTLSAKSETALRKKADELVGWLGARPLASVGDVCFSANTGRADFNHRLAVCAENREQLSKRLGLFVRRKRSPELTAAQVKSPTRPKVAFLFTGQGSQYTGMGRDLYEHHPEFRQALDECDEILLDHLEQPLLSVLFGDSHDTGMLDETAYTQPALFALEYSLAQLWRAWGVTPDVVLGHSVGEYAAACVAGVFSLEDGLRLIAERARLMQQLARNGRMSVVFAAASKVAELVQPYRDRVAIAAVNGPEITVISGEAEAIQKLVARFESSGIGTQMLTVSHAFHSPLMEPILDEFEQFATNIDFQPPQIPLASNVTGQLMDMAPDANYWRRHIRNTVCFADGMAQLEKFGPDVMLEVGPSTSLLGMGRRCLPQLEAAWLTSLRNGQDDWRTLLAALAQLYTRGVAIDWAGFERAWQRRRLALPTYPFERSRHWYKMPDDHGRRSFAAHRGRSLHPLLGNEVSSALEPRLFETHLSSHSPHYLVDHQVQGSPVMPAAAYLEQALAAAKPVFGEGCHVLENVAIQNAMFLPEGASRIAQMTISPEMGGECTFATYSLPLEPDADATRWTLHACGKLRSSTRHCEKGNSNVIDLEDARARIPHVTTREEFYKQMADRGLVYGPHFQVLGNMRRSDQEALAEVSLPNGVIGELEKYHLHPALLDGCFQTMAGVVPLAADGSQSTFTYVPTAVRRLRVTDKPTSHMWVYAVRTSTDDQTSPETVEGNVYLLDENGQVLVELTAVCIQRVGRAPSKEGAVDIRDWMYRLRWQLSPPTEGPPQSRAAGTWLIFSDAGGVGQELADRLQAHGQRCVLVRPHGQVTSGGDETVNRLETVEIDPLDSDDYKCLFEQTLTNDHPACRGIIHLWSLDIPSPQDSAEQMLAALRRLGVGSLLPLVQQLARFEFSNPPALTLVTRGAQLVADNDSVDPGQSPLWGMGRVATMEHPEFACRLIDLDPDVGATGLADVLETEFDDGSGDDQIAYRRGERFAARLDRQRALAPTGSRGLVAEQSVDDPAALNVPVGSPFRLRLRKSGSLDSVWFESCTRPKPESGQVEIEVRAAGLNFSDVLKAMGLYPGITDQIVPLGIECSGLVTAVGDGVDRFKVGDEVMGVAPYSFSSHTTTAEYALVRKPRGMADAEAATIPITFLTAYYALVRLATLRRGERMLIHAGAGGVGLAAIQIAQHLGAEIFATAGSDEKRDYLRGLGVPHVLNSRTLDFVDEIRDVTQRRGVDVVLNSLPGDAIPASLSVLAAHGRFLEIGKTDIYQNRMIGLSPFKDNLSFFAIDLDRMLRNRPAEIRELFSELMPYFNAGTYRPLPFTQFPVAETASAFRYMAQRRNIGKVVVSMTDRPAMHEQDESLRGPVRGAATYLITGGLGALGLKVAEWLADQGASHLALMSRSKPAGDVADRIAELNARGVHTVALQADVADRTSLARALAELTAEFPALRGVVHAAGTLADGVLLDMDPAQLEKVLAPKVQGAWNLHEATADNCLDFFVLFSSLASLLGSPGQGNYAAANAFLDGLAHFRQGAGLPATSINWGPWADAGMAADPTARDQLKARGLNSISPPKGLEVLGQLLRMQPAQVACVDARWPEMLRAMGNRKPRLLENFAEQQSAESKGSDEVDREFIRQLNRVDLDERNTLLRNYLRDELARIMGIDVDNIDIAQPLNSLGLDSLMAMELKINLEKRLAIELPVARLVEGPSVTSLADFLAASLAGHEEKTESRAGNWSAVENGSPVFPLCTGGEKRLFCLHPVGGDIRCYASLSRSLEEGLSVYALRARGLDDSLPPHASMEEMVQDYVEAIQRIQPHGPYNLAGWSTGGIFAYEMARKLRQQQDEIGALLLLDTPTPSIFDHVDLNDNARFVVDMVNFSNWFAGAKMSVSYQQLRLETFEEQLETVLREAKKHWVLGADTTIDRLRALVDVSRANVRVIMEYQPSAIDHPVHIIRPTEKKVLAEASGQDVVDDLGWSQVVSHLTLSESPGDHFSMMRGQNAKRLAEMMVERIENRLPARAIAGS